MGLNRLSVLTLSVGVGVLRKTEWVGVLSVGSGVLSLTGKNGLLIRLVGRLPGGGRGLLIRLVGRLPGGGRGLLIRLVGRLGGGRGLLMPGTGVLMPGIGVLILGIGVLMPPLTGLKPTGGYVSLIGTLVPLGHLTTGVGDGFLGGFGDVRTGFGRIGTGILTPEIGNVFLGFGTGSGLVPICARRVSIPGSSETVYNHSRRFAFGRAGLKPLGFASFASCEIGERLFPGLVPMKGSAPLLS